MEDQDGKAYSIMVKMGYKQGNGLGKTESGNISPIQVSAKNDKHGLGYNSNHETQDYDIWLCEDQIAIEEDLIWISSANNSESSAQFKKLSSSQLAKFIIKGEALKTLENQDNFCDTYVLNNVLETKEEIFERLDANELCKARSRANQFESIKSAFFMNRAALKMANIDAATDFMFSEIERDPRHKKSIGPYYFADVCAGPGGFSEYILWRKKWGFKGFGFTLRGEHDFKLMNSTCTSDATFRGYYGVADDGNVCNPDNIYDFVKRVKHETKNEGVHFMMADGGFSVEGNEGIQEILSKQIYVCQFWVALEIVRSHGHFVSKLFDTFTSFSVGLLFLMYHCFEKVAIIKPNSSRPANSERYFIGSGLKHSKIFHEIRRYLRHISKELWIKYQHKDKHRDIIDIVPLQIIKDDEYFYRYIRSQNTRIATKQAAALRKLEVFCENPQLIDTKQIKLRTKCLEYWRIPNKSRAAQDKTTVDDVIYNSVGKPDFMQVQACKILNRAHMDKHIVDVKDWFYMPLSCSQSSNSCSIFVGVSNSTAYKLDGNHWVKIKSLKLIKGTVLYGELIIEHSKVHGENTDMKALHVIDALRLGDTSLADLSFHERIPLIQTYCEAISFETTGSLMRVRHKMGDKLTNITQDSLIKYSSSEDSYFTNLPSVGYESSEEYYDVRSILLLKTDETHTFDTTYVLRSQTFIDDFKNEAENDDTYRAYNVFLQFIADNL